MADRLTPALEVPTPEEAATHPVLWGMYASEGLWKQAPHLWWLADKVMDLLSGEKRFLALSMPPGHGKSEFLSKYLPTYFLGTNPRGRVIQCSYAEALTLEWSRVSREILSAHGPAVFGVDVPARSSAKSWDVFRFDPKAGRPKREGYLRAVGRGGPITGKRMELGICDDLTKDDEEADSETMREKAWQWFLKVFLTRLTADGKAVLVQTRWHFDDVIGRLKDRQARGQDTDGWEILNLPAIAEENDPMGRKPGEALWPEMFPLAELERIRARDSHTWSALYQGNPVPAHGAMFKREWVKYASIEGDRIKFPDGKTVALEQCFRFGTVDLAVSEKTSADYTVLQAWAVAKDMPALVLLDQRRERIQGPDLVPAIAGLVDAWQLSVVEVEAQGFQLAITQQARRAGLPIRELKPDKDKVARAQPAAAAFSAGHVYLPAGRTWLAEYETELLQFPSAAHYDQVDATAYGVQVFHRFVRFGNRGDEEPRPRYEPKKPPPKGPSGPRTWRFGR